MEHARMFIAIVLSFLVFFVWETFFVDRETMKPTVNPTATQETQNLQSNSQAQTAPVSIAPVALTPDATVVEGKSDRRLIVETPLYTVTIADKGAVFKSLVLKNYRETAQEGSDNLEMIDTKIVKDGTLEVGFEGNDLPGLATAVYRSDVSADTLMVRDAEKRISYRWVSPDGVVVEKVFRFQPDSYLIPLTVTIRNESGRNINGNSYVALKKFSPDNDVRYGFEGPSALIDDHLEQVKVKDLDEKNSFSGKVNWMALQDRYFMSSLSPEATGRGTIKLSINGDRLLESRLFNGDIALKPGTQVSYGYQVFFGPLSVSLLKTLGHQLDRAVDFGWFDIIAKPCLWLMNFFYRFIPNYGVAIILLTILTKVLLWPLGNKSYKSMGEMKKIQPLMAEIREKYKDDKKKMNEEVMGLYRIYKINPMGGCLPMLVQIPVFFALYRMLYEAIELRHAPFFGWITDLSAPDRLFQFDFSIPMMEPPYGIPVLTVVMGATMFLQQKMSPPMGDPAQAKVMMFMPIIFTVIFINFSSGLVLYWLVNNVLSISQQYYVQKKMA
ncbi:MAG: membrane protein insertase YidC [Desulfobacterales bacterium]|nr:membrane protein insertase YidC [Desulfobacterales bacterium]